MSPKLKCHQNILVTTPEMSPEMRNTSCAPKTSLMQPVQVPVPVV